MLLQTTWIRSSAFPCALNSTRTAPVCSWRVTATGFNFTQAIFYYFSHFSTLVVLQKSRTQCKTWSTTNVLLLHMMHHTSPTVHETASPAKNTKHRLGQSRHEAATFLGRTVHTCHGGFRRGAGSGGAACTHLSVTTRSSRVSDTLSRTGLWLNSPVSSILFHSLFIVCLQRRINTRQTFGITRWAQTGRVINCDHHLFPLRNDALSARRERVVPGAALPGF